MHARRLALARPSQRLAQVVVRIGEPGRLGHRARPLVDRRLALAQLVEQVGQVVARLGLLGVERERRFVVGARVAALAATVV